MVRFLYYTKVKFELVQKYMASEEFWQEMMVVLPKN